MALFQGFLDLRQVTGERLRMRAGRQELSYGEERLIGAFGWDNVGRSFDGFKLTVPRGRTSVDLFAARLALPDPVAPLPQLGNPNFLGIYGRRQGMSWGDVEAYALGRSGTVGGPPGQSWTFGVRPVGRFGDTRRFDFSVEAAIQAGTTGGRRIAASAAHGAVGYTFPGSSRIRAAIEYNLATGGNPDDPRTVRTFDQLFPTNHDKYGYMDYQGWRNMRNLRLSLGGRVGSKGWVGGDFHEFWLADSRDSWYGAGGSPNRTVGGGPYRDPTGAAGNRVGRELDLTVRINARERLLVLAGVARFWPGSFVRNVNGSADPSDWAYWQAQYSF